MSRQPPIPPEQRSIPSAKPRIKGERLDRRELNDGVETHEHGDAGVNLREQGRFGNIRQNLTPQRRVQDR